METIFKTINFWLILSVAICYGESATVAEIRAPSLVSKTAVLLKEDPSGTYGCRCQWTKNVNVFFEVSFASISDLSDAEISKKNCSPRLFGIESADDGQWRCTKMVGPTKMSLEEQNTKLKAISPLLASGDNTKRAITQVPQSVNVTIGGDITLRCKFSTPSPWCFWTNDGVVTAIEGRYVFLGDRNSGDCSITISNVSGGDNGNWNCRYPKTDERDEFVSKNATVIVVVAPLPPVITVNGVALTDGQKIFIPDSESQTITCWSLNGNPASQIRWTTGGNGTRVSTYRTTRVINSDVSKLHNSFFPLTTSSITRRAQHTNLTCHAIQSIGQKNSTRSVSVELIWPTTYKPTTEWSYSSLFGDYGSRSGLSGLGSGSLGSSSLGDGSDFASIYRRLLISRLAGLTQDD